jgi:hypothetical protein
VRTNESCGARTFDAKIDTGETFDSIKTAVEPLQPRGILTTNPHISSACAGMRRKHDAAAINRRDETIGNATVPHMAGRRVDNDIK